MKDFLIKIYSNENFPIILFSIIGVLLVLFVITLILALHDANKTAKKNAMKEEDNLKENDLEMPVASEDNKDDFNIYGIDKEYTQKLPAVESKYQDFSFDDSNTAMLNTLTVDEETPKEEVEVVNYPLYEEKSVDSYENNVSANWNNKYILPVGPVELVGPVNNSLNNQYDQIIKPVENNELVKEESPIDMVIKNNLEEVTSIFNVKPLEESVLETNSEPILEPIVEAPKEEVKVESTPTKVVNEEIILPLPKTKVVAHEPIINVRSLDDIEKEEYTIRR